jgi:hypothetical protein
MHYDELRVTLTPKVYEDGETSTGLLAPIAVGTD